MNATITGHTTPAGYVVLTATFADGRTVSRRTKRDYPLLVVKAYQSPTNSAVTSLTIVKGTSTPSYARCARDRNHNAQILRRHADGTYTTDGAPR